MSKKSSTFAPAFEKKTSIVNRQIVNFLVSLAQLVEQLTLNQWVESSSLSGDTKTLISVFFLFFFFFICVIQKIFVILRRILCET